MEAKEKENWTISHCLTLNMHARSASNGAYLIASKIHGTERPVTRILEPGGNRESCKPKIGPNCKWGRRQQMTLNQQGKEWNLRSVRGLVCFFPSSSIFRSSDGKAKIVEYGQVFFQSYNESERSDHKQHIWCRNPFNLRELSQPTEALAWFLTEALFQFNRWQRLALWYWRKAYSQRSLVADLREKLYSTNMCWKKNG